MSRRRAAFGLLAAVVGWRGAIACTSFHGSSTGGPDGSALPGTSTAGPDGGQAPAGSDGLPGVSCGDAGLVCNGASPVCCPGTYGASTCGATDCSPGGVVTLACDDHADCSTSGEARCCMTGAAGVVSAQCVNGTSCPNNTVELCANGSLCRAGACSTYSCGVFASGAPVSFVVSACAQPPAGCSKISR